MSRKFDIRLSSSSFNRRGRPSAISGSQNRDQNIGEFTKSKILVIGCSNLFPMGIKIWDLEILRLRLRSLTTVVLLPPRESFVVDIGNVCACN
ncbi:unnamed protein product [Arabidopsis halleri]